MRKGLRIAIIIVFTPSPIGTQAGTAQERSILTATIYMISAADSKYDLPLYPRLQPASRHDAVSLVISMIEFKQRFNLGTVDKMLLDAARCRSDLSLTRSSSIIVIFLLLFHPTLLVLTK